VTVNELHPESFRCKPLMLLASLEFSDRLAYLLEHAPDGANLFFQEVGDEIPIY